MALPTCPKCRQSVLEDDAEFCPFCGASMSGKGPSKNPAPPPRVTPKGGSPASGAAPAITPSMGPAANPAGLRPAGIAPVSTKPGEDDPFAVHADVSQAISISGQKTARFTETITCPMCDTEGFIPPQAAGRDVRCRNPNCLAPVFVAPKKLQPPQALNPVNRTTKSSVPVPLILSVSVLLVVVLGGVGWYVYLRPQPKAPVIAQDSGVQMRENPAASSTEVAAPVEEQSTGETESQLPAKAERSGQQVINAMLATSGRDELNRSKPTCIRLTSYAMALQGETESALEQLQRMMKLSSGTPHYQIEALTQLVWNVFREGKKDQAKPYVETLRSAVASLGEKGKDRLDLAIQVGAVLAATGDLKGANELIALHQDATPVGQLSGAVQIARALGTFDIHRWIPGTKLGGWTSPQRVAITVLLVSHGESSVAEEWVASSGHSGELLESLIAYLESTEALHPQVNRESTFQSVKASYEKLSPAGKALVQLRMGFSSQSADDQESALSAVKTAVELLNTLPEPTPLLFKNYEEFLKQGFPDLELLHQQSLASFALAMMKSRLGDQEEAAKWLTRALNSLRAASYSQVQLESVDAQITSQGKGAFEKELKKIFQLKNDDEARRRGNEIVRKIASWKSVAERRFELQSALIGSIENPGLKEMVLKEIETRSADSDVNLRENFKNTALNIRLTQASTEWGPKHSGFYLGESLASLSSQSLWEKRREWVNLVGQGKSDEVRRLTMGIEKADDSEYWLTWELNRLVSEKQAATAFRIANQLSNIIHREELVRLISAQAIVTDQATAAWEANDSPILVPTVKVSGYAGILEGLKSASEKRMTKADTPNQPASQP